MYRPYTTTGTNKLKGIFLFFWVLAAAGSRAAYFYFRGGAVSDTYGYFAAAMVRSETGEPVLDSGLVYAYTRNLSGLLKFTGNRIAAVGVYQTVLQILWLVLLLAALVLLVGWMLGGVCGSILLVSPGVMETVLVISPGNYYLLHVSLILVMLGLIYRRIKKKGGVAGDGGRLCLIATGFYAGVVCIWNLLGFGLVFVMGYVLAKGHRKTIARTDESARQIMGTGLQVLSLCEGVLLGIFVTLMRYTGLTGQAIVDQFLWWFLQIQEPLRQLQDIQLSLLIWFSGAVGAGILCQILYGLKKREQAGTVSEETQEVTEKVEQQDNYVITGDGRRVRLLDNPLPGPKKHVRREMEFDITEVTQEDGMKDDFDVQIRENDDFDI